MKVFSLKLFLLCETFSMKHSLPVNTTKDVLIMLMRSIKLYPAGIYLLKVNNRNTRTRCEICSKLIIKYQNNALASFRYLYCWLWTYFTPCSIVSIVNFEHVFGGWDGFVPEKCVQSQAWNKEVVTDVCLKILVS